MKNLAENKTILCKTSFSFTYFHSILIQKFYFHFPDNLFIIHIRIKILHFKVKFLLKQHSY